MDKDTKKNLAIKDLETATKQLRELNFIPEEGFGILDDDYGIGKTGYHKNAESVLRDIDLFFANNEISRNKELLKKIISKKNLSPEELKENIGAALRLSLGPELLPRAKEIYENYRIGATGEMRNPDFYPILETVPIDKDRRITIRKSPYGEFIYSAEKLPEELKTLRSLEKKIKDYGRGDYFEGERFLSTKPSYLDSFTSKLFKPEELASLDITPAGHINFINSGKRGIAEGAMPRLLLEAASRGQVPHSSHLLAPGQKFTERMARDFQRPEFMDIIKRFLDIGKVGKYWSTVAPLLGKGAAAAAGGLASLAAEASDTEEEGSKLEEAAMLREREEEMRRDNLRKMLGKEQASQAEGSYEELTRPMQYKRLKDILK